MQGAVGGGAGDLQRLAVIEQPGDWRPTIATPTRRPSGATPSENLPHGRPVVPVELLNKFARLDELDRHDLQPRVHDTLLLALPGRWPTCQEPQDRHR
jgi:hypothetical protein